MLQIKWNQYQRNPPLHCKAASAVAFRWTQCIILSWTLLHILNPFCLWDLLSVLLLPTFPREDNKIRFSFYLILMTLKILKLWNLKMFNVLRLMFYNNKYIEYKHVRCWGGGVLLLKQVLSSHWLIYSKWLIHSEIANDCLNAQLIKLLIHLIRYKQDCVMIFNTVVLLWFCWNCFHYFQWNYLAII